MHADDLPGSDSAGAMPTDWVRYRPAAMSGVKPMRAHFTEHAFERHSHPEYGIGLTHSGIQTFHCRGTVQTSVPGDLIFLNPNQAHDGLPGTDQGYGHAMHTRCACGADVTRRDRSDGAMPRIAAGRELDARRLRDAVIAAWRNSQVRAAADPCRAAPAASGA